MTDERSSSSILKKRFPSPRRGSNPQSILSNKCMEGGFVPAYFSDYHELLVHFMRNWSLEGCRFDPCLGLRNCFLRKELDERSSIIVKTSMFKSWQLWMSGRTFCRRKLCQKTFCRTDLFSTEVFPKGQFKERNILRYDILPNSYFAKINPKCLRWIVGISKDFLSYYESTLSSVCHLSVDGAGRCLVRSSRTNSSVEGWHHSFDPRVAIAHPTICWLAAKLLKEKAIREFFLEQVFVRISLPPSKRTSQWTKDHVKFWATLTLGCYTYVLMLTACETLMLIFQLFLKCVFNMYFPTAVFLNYIINELVISSS